MTSSKSAEEGGVSRFIRFKKQNKTKPNEQPTKQTNKKHEKKNYSNIYNW